MNENRYDSSTRPFLIVGGTGKTGRRVAARLEARGHAVRIGSRSGTPVFDWTDRSTWGPALEGASAAYVTYYPDLLIGEAADDIAEFSKEALDKGVARIVLLSGRGEDGARKAEQALVNSGVDWTIVRASWFNQNFNESFLADAVRSGVVALPVGDIVEPFLDADDIADVAVAALTDDRHTNQLYELTGPHSLTFTEVVTMIAQASGREVRFEPISMEAFVGGLRHEGVPEGYIALLVELFSQIFDGRNSRPTDGVYRALGREPRGFSDFARDAAATGVWAAGAGAHG